VIHAPRHRALAREILSVAAAPMPLPGFTPASAPESTTVILAENRAAWARATGGAAPEWAGGIAIPDLRLIVLPAFPYPGSGERETRVTLRHELAHLHLAARVPGPIPRWFHEGYAEVAAGGWDAEAAWQLRLALLLGRAPPLDSLTLGWPAGGDRARLAYLLSATAVDHLQRRGGERGFALLMDNWRREGSWERGLRATYGLTTGQLEDEWARSVRSRYGWVLVMGNAAVIWVIAGVVVVIAWIPRRRRRRARLEALRAEERMLPPPRPDWDQADYPIAEPPPLEQ
jgi:hypothetical protein